MRTTFTLNLFLVAVMALSSCAGRKQLEKGNYDEAVYKSVKKLRNNPDNRRAKEILAGAYKYAKEAHLREIEQLQASQAMYKWDDIVWRYERLNSLHDEIKRCPACMSVVKHPVYFIAELDSARVKASRIHFEEGQRLMEQDDHLKAREAYGHFVKAREFTPQFTKIDDWIEASLERGTINVVIEDIPVHSRSLQLTNEFFQNQIREFAQNLNYTFVRFYSPQEAESLDLRVDQVIRIQFDDFVIGQTFVKETVEKLQKDSVKVGDMSTEEGDKIPVYGTVKADFHHFRKTVTSTGLMDFQIVDAVTGETLKQQKFPGTYVWESEWGFFNGDEKALTNDQLNITKRRETFPPAPQDLFVAFTQPIYSQITNQLRNYYRIHN